MKRTIYIILLLHYAQLTYGQIQSNCNNNATLVGNAYADDINYLAVQRLFDIQSPDTSLIIVPQIHKDSVLTAMLGVYNLGSQLESDSVFSNYCVHEYQAYYKAVLLKIDTNIAWTQAWQNQQVITGNMQIDNLVSSHGFMFGSIHYYSNGTFVVLETNNNINLKAFCDSIALVNGILEAQVEKVLDISDQILYNRTNTGSTLSFAKRYGLLSNKVWDYTIDNNCQVQMNKSTNDPSYKPPIVNCNLWPLSTKEHKTSDIKIYPNPTTDFINITANKKGNAILRDATGRTIYELVVDKTVTIDFSNLVSGMYLLEFKNEQGSVIKKILKE